MFGNALDSRWRIPAASSGKLDNPLVFHRVVGANRRLRPPVAGADGEGDGLVAEVQPFRGWRYPLSGAALAAVAAPPYDVIEHSTRQKLLDKDVRNIVAVDLPADGYDEAAALWRKWRREGVVVQEGAPALYGYKQIFADLGGRETARFGVMGAVRLAAYEEGVVFPHERTLSGPKEDRLQLMRATRAQLSPVFGLTFGAATSVEELLAPFCGGDADEGGPVSDVTDVDGVRHQMWVLTDADLLKAVADALAPARIVIADGHHRYETALAFRDEERLRQGGGARAGESDGVRGAAAFDGDRRAWNYVQMMLVDIQSPGLTVFPTHRIFRPAAAVDGFRTPELLGDMFSVQALEGGDVAAAAARALEGLGEGIGFVVYGGAGGLWLVTLKDEAGWQRTAADKPAAWRALDVAVLHSLALPRFGLDDAKQSSGEYMAYSHDVEEAVAAVDRGEGTAAVLVRPTPSSAVKDVALAGHNMPQKSTYYYPKLLTGLVMSDLDTPVGL